MRFQVWEIDWEHIWMARHLVFYLLSTLAVLSWWLLRFWSSSWCLLSYNLFSTKYYTSLIFQFILFVFINVNTQIKLRGKNTWRTLFGSNVPKSTLITNIPTMTSSGCVWKCRKSCVWRFCAMNMHADLDNFEWMMLLIFIYINCTQVPTNASSVICIFIQI